MYSAIFANYFSIRRRFSHYEHPAYERQDMRRWANDDSGARITLLSKTVYEMMSSARLGRKSYCSREQPRTLQITVPDLLAYQRNAWLGRRVIGLELSPVDFSESFSGPVLAGSSRLYRLFRI